MPKKKYTLTAQAPVKSKAKASQVGFDGTNRDYKDIPRNLIAYDNLARGEDVNPIRMFTLLGAACSDYILFRKLGLKIKTCVSVEYLKEEFKRQKKTIKNMCPEDSKAVIASHDSVRSYFSITDDKQGKAKDAFTEGFDLMFLDYLGSYSTELRLDIVHLLANKEMLDAAFERQKDIFFYLTTTSRYPNPGDLDRLYAEASENYPHLNPEIDDTNDDGSEDANLYTDHLQCYGLHYDISKMFLKENIHAEQIHCLYYKDGNPAAKMLFTGWRLTKISEKEAKVVEPLPPLQPVYVGIDKRKNHARSIEWVKKMEALNIITFQDNQHRLTSEVRSIVKAESAQHTNRLDKFLRLGSTKGDPIFEVTSNKPKLLYPAPLRSEVRLDILSQKMKLSTKNDQKQDWAKMAVAIGNCLKEYKGAVSQRTLVNAVLKDYPEYNGLLTEQAGKLNQSKLTNRMAWAKSALKSGGYTISKKDSVVIGEVLRLTEKGRQVNFNRASTTNWNDHYVLIKKGQI